MTAQSLNVFALDLPDPEWTQGDAQRINQSVSFDLFDATHLRTLSPNTLTTGDSVKGLLYVPELQSFDPCTNISERYLPTNVTRREDLPDSQFPLVALAPWISINCTSSYLAAARRDPVKAFIFYHPDNETTQPPPVNDPSWSLQDGGRWKSQNLYGIYAVPGSMGALLMEQLSLYSGNMTSVPYGQELTEIYDPRDYVRLFALMDIGNGGSTLPSLWIFLLIVLGILVAIIGGTSFLMRMIQRKHRQNLRRRVANGEVDLEALGIKRLNVPQEVLDKMPLHIYSSEDSIPDQPTPCPPSLSSLGPSSPGGTISTPSPAADAIPAIQQTSVPSSLNTEDRATDPSRTRDSASPESMGHLVRFAQHTCPICLDDFEPAATQVRELPCGHIFHPECVDTFLRQNSSLCPMCKKSVLPLGYCPDHVTNAMVRRERLVRRMRERVTLEVVQNPHEQTETTHFGRSVAFGRSLTILNHQFGNTSRRGASRTPTPGLVEMVSNIETSAVGLTPGSDLAPTTAERRRERGRNRILASLSNRRTIEDEDIEREVRLPKWRKAIGSVFPMLR